MRSTICNRLKEVVDAQVRSSENASENASEMRIALAKELQWERCVTLVARCVTLVERYGESSL